MHLIYKKEQRRNLDKAFGFFKVTDRPSKPRDEGITEVRDINLSLRQVEDLIEVAGDYIDVLKMSSGSQRLLSRDIVKKKIKLCHKNNILVSTGGFLERVMLQGTEAIEKFLEEAKSLEYDIVEVSNGLAIMSLSDKVRLMRRVIDCGFRAKPEIAQAYGITVEEEVPISAEKLVAEAKILLENGAWMVMVESEGLTENVKEWKIDVIHKIASSIELKKLMFEGADVDVIDWYIRNYGPNINLYVDQSQVLDLEMRREGIWGKKNSWGRVVSYRED